MHFKRGILVRYTVPYFTEFQPFLLNLKVQVVPGNALGKLRETEV